MRAVLTAMALGLFAASAMAAPADEPNRGQNVADYPPPVWVEAGPVHRWLDSVRERFTPLPCRPAPSSPPPADWCGGGIPRGIPPATGFLPRVHVKAGVAVRVGQVIRFHLPGVSATRPVLTVGLTARVGQHDASGGRAHRLGTTDAPWWRVRKETRSGFATLTTSTGTYWFKLAVRP